MKNSKILFRDIVTNIGSVDKFQFKLLSTHAEIASINLFLFPSTLKLLSVKI